MLNDQGIADTLRNALDHLRQGNLEQAAAHLKGMRFDRLLKPIRDPSVHPSRRVHFIDPAASFGAERVHETGDHIRACLDAIAANDRTRAIAAAEDAAARWAQVPPSGG